MPRLSQTLHFLQSPSFLNNNMSKPQKQQAELIMPMLSSSELC